MRKAAKGYGKVYIGCKLGRRNGRCSPAADPEKCDVLQLGRSNVRGEYMENSRTINRIDVQTDGVHLQHFLKVET